MWNMVDIVVAGTLIESCILNTYLYLYLKFNKRPKHLTDNHICTISSKKDIKIFFLK